MPWTLAGFSLVEYHFLISTIFDDDISVFIDASDSTSPAPERALCHLALAECGA